MKHGEWQLRELTPISLFGLTLIGMLALHSLWPLAEHNVCMLQWAAISPAGFGLWLLWGGRRDPRRCGQQADKLCTSGIYSYSRNPLSLGLLMLLAATALLLESLSPWLMPPLFIALVQRHHIRIRERRLLARFGRDYWRYCQYVGRWM